MQNIIIVGFGFMGGMHAQVYSQLARATVVAIVDTNRLSAIANAKRLGLDVPVYGDLDAALLLHAVDVIDICLPTPLHGNFVRRALRARKHIFCEKPFTPNTREALTLARA